MTTREAFETEARKHGFILDRLDKSGVYVQLITEQAWSIWQAATTAALSAPETATDEQLRKDAERFVWYESNSEKVLNIGPCWYSRKGYGLPMKRRNGFREAIDAAMKGTP